ncbi:hypothetical protein Q5P01_013474 [Channa striata]|uniref:Uncharacterized protein n=1 Tax=Channa striata TaxID=64152 RepID=A0AA88MP60_CHASR|nr:hypothetical protein Q5P01_013474 [Channa striata]
MVSPLCSLRPCSPPAPGRKLRLVGASLLLLQLRRQLPARLLHGRIRLVWCSDTGEEVTGRPLHGRTRPQQRVLTQRVSMLECYAVSEASVVACCFSPCCQMFVTGCTYGHLKLWDVDLSLLSAEKDAHDLGVTCCSFVPLFQVDGCCVQLRLASCGQDNQLKIWIVSQREGTACTMKLLHTLTSQSAPVLSCGFSSDGDLVVGVQWIKVLQYMTRTWGRCSTL